MNATQNSHTGTGYFPPPPPLGGPDDYGPTTLRDHPPSAPDVLRDAALRSLGPPPDRLAVPCERCGAPPGAECAWCRAPGPPVLHAERRRRVDGLAAAHCAAVDALAAHAAAVAVDGPVHAAAIRARHTHRLLRLRAASVAWPVPALPDPALMLSTAGAGASR